MNPILIIDDDKVTLDISSKILERSGYKVLITSSGEEGINLLDDGLQVSLVITDINMPKMGGNDVAEYIGNSPNLKDIPIIAMTGSTSNVKKELFNDVIEKPFGFEQLVSAVRLFI